MRPQGDLYRYVNGSWLAKTEIPADKSNYGAFTILADGAEKNLRAIAEEDAAAHVAAGTDQQLIDYLARAQVVGIENFIDSDVLADAKNPDLNTIWLTQTGFGLPERDYYFSKEKRFTEIRAACLKHIENVFALAGRKDGAATAKAASSTARA